MLGWQEGLPQDGLAIVHFIIIYPNGFGQPRGDIGSACLGRVGIGEYSGRT